jgi:hypothetical protein
MATLTGELISETYDSLLKVTDNNTITGVKKRITDGFGNEIPLQLSSTDIEIDGTLILSALTDLGAATKFLSLKADNSVAYRTASEVLTDIGGASSSSISGTTGNIAKFTSTGAVGDSILEEIGNAIHLTDGTSSYASFGIINPGVDNDCYIGSTINNDFIIRVNNTEALRIDTNFRLKIANIQNATSDTDKFLVSDGGVVKYRTGTELRSDIGAGVGSVTSVGLTMPVAFSVANSPITSAGTLEVTATGTASQYIRGDGTLATIPSTSSGGANVNYYLNGSIAASVATYKQMANSAIIGGGTDFNLTGNGLIAQFLTDAGNPNRLLIPGGAWNFEMYFNISSSGGNSKFYVELLKYDGTTFTSIASSSAVPEEITGGTTTDLYITSLAVPETVLLITDRLALRVYIVNNSGGRTVTFHTEDNTLCLVTTTFAGGIAALNGLTANTQYFATGTTGTDFNISSVLDTHTFNLPSASATNRGALSSANWSTFNGKENVLTFSSPLVRTLNTISIPAATSTINGYLSSTDWTTFNSKQNTITLTTTGTSGAATFISNTLNIPQYTVLSLAAIGITPNANGASIVGSLLSLQPADASFGGVITTGAQTIAGAKTLTGALGGTSASFSGNVNAASFSSTGQISTGNGADADILINVTAAGATNKYAFLQSSVSGRALALNPTNGGNVLIGTTTDSGQKLQVTGGATITGILKLGSADNTFVYESSGSLILQTGASARLTINSAGNTTISGTLNGTSATFSGRIGTSLSSSGANFNNSSLYVNNTANTKGGIFGYNDIADNFYFTALEYGVAYKPILFNTSAAIFSGNLGLGVTPSAWGSTFKAIEIGRIGDAILSGSGGGTIISANAYFGASSWIYARSGAAANYDLGGGEHRFYTAPSGTAGNAISFTQAMTLTANGRLLINTPTESTYQLDVNGTGRFSGQLMINQAINNNYIAFNHPGTQTWYARISTDNTSSFVIRNDYANGTNVLTLAETGAATFSSSVTANGEISSANTSGSAGSVKISGTQASAKNYQFTNVIPGVSNIGFTLRNTTDSRNELTFDGNGAATFSSSVTATAFFESSDSRLKTLITDNHQAKGIESITAKLYTKNGVEELGYFAQDVQSVLPSAVIERDDTYLDLSYRQVHTAKIANLEKEIKELKDLIKQLI